MTIRVEDKRSVLIARDDTLHEALRKLRALKWDVPADFRFDHEEAHERGWRIGEVRARPPGKRKT